MRAPLVDGFGRVHTDLRLSLTDRCNLRCTYCMPAEGLDWLPKPELLTDDEVKQLDSLPDRFKVCGDAWLPVKVFFGDDE